MFPALISEIINADLEYRTTRSRRSFLEQRTRRSGRVSRRATGRDGVAPSPTVASPTWTPRSV
jgi:hypothetical protein